MKTVLVCKNRKVAPKSKRKWKKYWGIFELAYFSEAFF